MQHSFDISIAEKYGVNTAIFLNHLAFWIKKNQANNKHFHDGRHWTYNSVQAYSILFPYWTQKQMRLILDKLKESGLVMTGNYNLTPYDRTQWYSLSDLGHELLGLPICPNRQIDLENGANGFVEKGEPIPDIKPDIKPDKKKKEKKKKPPTLQCSKINHDFKPTEKNIELAKKLSLNLEIELLAFINYYDSRDKSMVRWASAFNTWLIKSYEFKKQAAGLRKEHPVTASIRELKETLKVDTINQLLN